MNKKKTAICIGCVLGAILTVAGICAGIYAWRMHKINVMVEQQNYLASKLLETGRYEEGRIMAAQCQQMRENEFSQELLVIAAGFQADYEVGLLYIQKFLEKGEDPVLSSAKEIYEDAVHTLTLVSKEDRGRYNEAYNSMKDKVGEKLTVLLLKVQNKISVKKNGENMLAMLDVITGAGVTQEALALLEEDDSLLSRKVQMTYAIDRGQYEKAYEKAESLLGDNGCFENRALVANLAARRAPAAIQDSRVDRLMEQQAALQEQKRGLEAQYIQESNAAVQRDISQEMEEVQRRIDELQQEIDAIPAQKAINFIETTTPVRERDTVAYKIELSRLYYQAADRAQARDLLLEVIRREEEAEEVLADVAGFLFSDFLNGYLDNNGSADDLSYGEVETKDLKLLWNRMARLLGFVEAEYNQEDPFYDFLLNTLNQLYNGLIIRRIDATAFPRVRVTVNVSMELERALQKENFTVVEQGAPVQDFELLDTELLEDTGNLSVALVVDRSGSMGGKRMEDTQKAVTNFVRNIDDSIQVGLLVFDSQAQVVASVGSNRNQVLQGISSIQVGGGTSIYSGLQLAGQELEGEQGRKVIILLSDGEDGSAGKIDGVLDDLKRRGISVYTIGVGGADTEYLSYIARKCGGKFIQADSSEVLGEIYSAIGEYMVNDYVIEFTVVTDPEDFSRTLRITVDIDDAFAEKDYHVGVPFDAIEEEMHMRPMGDYFQQIGGSWTETEQGALE